ncbi:flagellar basal-body rod protein FlgG [Algimonas ampicilliniresistens]|uniref:Flagellar basal-body rod protein FlgG n=1 Tax=Algimonas ampicilliniresistens TaxID=1298735 RepID=A0ABQ5V9Z4_9PROT|nr:flagellar basal-body rod protein FlgG [Algimonas ampicilliniresistens]GLQ24349.1 flagellar basal-body rod protein FlgG [Algimonas ampicilliniresistens]
MNALKIAATGMAAQQMRVDVISNNIANMSTTAYQPRVAEFADLMYQQYQTPGTLSSQTGATVPAGIQIGMGVRPTTVSMEIVQGGLSETGGDFDLAIEGRGFFEIIQPSGDSAFTRDGKFYRDADGLMVNSDGYALADQITIPNDARRVTISPDGEVVAYFNNQPNGQTIGSITLTVFANTKGLEAMGGNLYRETEASGAPINGTAGTEGIGTMRQGYLEDSGVDVVEEISELIEAQRGYELNSKIITAADEMLAATTRIR